MEYFLSSVTMHGKILLALAAIAAFLIIGGEGNQLFAQDVAVGQVFYVSPDGSDNGPGTMAKPWKTLARASAVKAGDTVIFLPGTYPGVLQPQNSGTEDAPVSFRAKKKGTVTLTGRAADEYHYAVMIKGKNHIEVAGFHIAPQNPKYGRWLRIDSTDPDGKCINDKDPGTRPKYIRISNLVMEKAFGKGGAGLSIPFIVRNASHIQVEDNIFRLFAGGDMAWFQCNDRVLYQGNAISYAGHSPTALSPLFRFKSNSHFVIRANVFHGGWSRPFETFGDRNILFEDNVVTHGYHGGYSAGPEAKLMLDQGIFRYNRIYRNFGSPINIHYERLEADAGDTYLYNNVFADNYSDGVNLNSVVENYVFKNNIFFNNDEYGGSRQLFFGGDAKNSRYIGNIFWGAGAEDLFNYTDEAFGLGKPLSLSDVQSAEWETRHGKQFNDNKNMDPQFISPVNHNYALQPCSFLMNAGKPLTQTVNTGSGKTVKVENAGYFYDGYGIEGEVGDLIAVGKASRKARVKDIDRGENTLTLDRPVKWKKGDPVSLAWSGSAPDIGAYEHGGGGRASVQIETSPFRVSMNQPVVLKAKVRGINKPVSYRWRLGDGTEAAGKRVEYRYTRPFVRIKGGAPGGYPVFLKVRDEEGRTYRAAAYVELKRPAPDSEPLVSINFDANNHPAQGEPNFKNNDGNWWWRFYHSRPTTDITVKRQQDGNGVGYFSIDEDQLSAHAEIYPAEWDIDKYPLIKFRYRIPKDTPIAVYLQAFNTTKQIRRVQVASVNGVNVTGDNVVAKNTLVDDNKWHAITIDARAVRKKFPGVKVLQQFYIGAADPSKMEKGDGYYLDDFRIVADSEEQSGVPAF